MNASTIKTIDASEFLLNMVSVGDVISLSVAFDREVSVGDLLCFVSEDVEHTIFTPNFQYVTIEKIDLIRAGVGVSQEDCRMRLHFSLVNDLYDIILN
jgi:hypothetical protein